jgi:hypothetical protein
MRPSGRFVFIPINKPINSPTDWFGQKHGRFAAVEWMMQTVNITEPDAFVAVPPDSVNLAPGKPGLPGSLYPCGFAPPGKENQNRGDRENQLSCACAALPEARLASRLVAYCNAC